MVICKAFKTNKNNKQSARNNKVQNHKLINQLRVRSVAN